MADGHLAAGGVQPDRRRRSLDPSALGRLGAWALLFFLVTTLIASALGVGIALALQPGTSYIAADNASVPDTVWKDTAPSKEVLDSFLDLVRNLFPSIPFQPGVRNLPLLLYLL